MKRTYLIGRVPQVPLFDTWVPGVSVYFVLSFPMLTELSPHQVNAGVKT